MHEALQGQRLKQPGASGSQAAEHTSEGSISRSIFKQATQDAHKNGNKIMTFRQTEGASRPNNGRGSAQKVESAIKKGNALSPSFVAIERAGSQKKKEHWPALARSAWVELCKKIKNGLMNKPSKNGVNKKETIPLKKIFT